MNVSYYKCCAVPMCKSTSISSPQKLFINIPKSAQIRRKWLTLASRHPASLTPTSTSHFCEDHFDLQNDMENYVEYTTMGVVSRIRMRPGCLPTKFACQPKGAHASTSADVCQPTDAKRLRLNLIKECEDEKRAAALQQSENLNIEVPSQDTLHEEQQELTKIDKGAHIYTAKNRSKSTQSKTKSCRKQTSPVKFSSTSVSTSPFKILGLKTFIKPKPLCSSVTSNLNNDEKTDSDISLHTPSRALVSKSSDTSSSNESELKKVANLKCVVEHIRTVDKIQRRSQFYIGVPKNCYDLIKIIHERTSIP